MFLRVVRQLTAIVALGAVFLGSVSANDPVVRIEEDWELTVKVPEQDVTAPQIITAFTPLADLSGVHATFEINHIASAAFAAGGLHLTTWCGEAHLNTVHAGDYALMSNDGEVVCWTQALEIDDDQLIFEIINGTSTTWGSFGSEGSLRLALANTLDDLSSYRPTVSIAKSEVNFSGNRVEALSMKRIRYIRASGGVTTENAQRYVHRAE